jgi:transposase-like protein
MGRPPKLTRHERREALARLANNKETLVQIARTYDVSQMTISRLKQAVG